MFHSPVRIHELATHSMRATRSCHCGAAADDSQRQPTIATGKTCMKWTIAAVLRSTCVLFQGKLFFLPEAAAKICKLPVAIVWQSSAVVGSRPMAENNGNVNA